ncbi:MAG: VTT domain-containing protein [Bradyrhizobium sp.]|jgi:membrane protein YqaA with SNARE-associated domain|uniref:VTT domain-containing protein n=1 Tax=Bradyrhizobium denitrificans TaxID=2734912 RepID=A0ABS5G203_9BRAD|nr:MULTISPECIES: VTT domain-containing protein [Bradyrhizobium]MBR1135278.1 VTT domain-containing protein [Bradyrhizobium denitrificans]MDU0955592.1 VTT domain-containing protein [Bradyrhizobium sp.]MDU1495662.1 VTT domain-containing protein [Bradyrhizobium sp.]MDU1545834.1 VTT domain-containing protein [Bradyrhizobium sp.]MDU1804566.1 VTT domain-containing protein [Bradyrhizobium sp.]
MIMHAMTRRALAYIVWQGERPEFAPLLGALSFLATITLAVPVEWLVVVGTLTNRRRWLSVAACAATGSSLAAIGFYFAFHHLGWSMLAERYPELAGTRAWLQASDWISRYGPLALFGLMALPLPIPKLPMLAVAGLHRLPIQEVVIAIWSGKIIKYTLYAYVVTRFPRTIHRIVHAT